MKLNCYPCQQGTHNDRECTYRCNCKHEAHAQ